MLELRAVEVHYGKNRVLSGVSLHAARGEIVSLVGPNSAGKTTTLRTAAGLKESSSGRLVFDGAEVTRLPAHERVRRGLALVPEGRQVFPRFTVQENLLMGAYHRADRNRLGEDFERVFDLFPRLGERRGQKAGLMSGGEQQMLAIARGLMARPKCLMLDEPTLGLAPRIVEEILLTLRRLAAEGLTVVLAEQNAAAALDCAQRAYVIQSGSVVLEGDTDSLRASDAVRGLYLGH